jgi:hypothetical protein
VRRCTRFENNLQHIPGSPSVDKNKVGGPDIGEIGRIAAEQWVATAGHKAIEIVARRAIAHTLPVCVAAIAAVVDGKVGFTTGVANFYNKVVKNCRCGQCCFFSNCLRFGRRFLVFAAAGKCEHGKAKYGRENDSFHKNVLDEQIELHVTVSNILPILTYRLFLWCISNFHIHNLRYRLCSVVELPELKPQ